MIVGVNGVASPHNGYWSDCGAGKLTVEHEFSFESTTCIFWCIYGAQRVATVSEERAQFFQRTGKFNALGVRRVVH